MSESSNRNVHSAAKTTEIVRREIQSSRETSTTLAARYGINRKTVQKWRNRSEVQDVSPGRPKDQASTVLTKEEEAIIIGFRRLSLLPLDDCLYALQYSIPKVSRSSLHRCFQRYGISRLPETIVDKKIKRTLEDHPIGYFHIDVGETVTGEGHCLVFAATDLVSRLFYAELHDRADHQAPVKFLEGLIGAVPYKIHTVMTVNGMPFSYPSRKSLSGPMVAHSRIFDDICIQNNIEHELISPDRAWSNIQLKRTESPQYESHRHLEEYIRAFILDYNFSKRLKIINGRTPYQFVCEKWATHAEWFKRSPLHLNHGTRRGVIPHWNEMEAAKF